MKQPVRTDLKLADLLRLLRSVSDGIDKSARYMASGTDSVPAVGVLVQHTEAESEKRMLELQSIAGAMKAAGTALLPKGTQVAVNFVKERTHSICVIKFKGWIPGEHQ